MNKKINFSLFYYRTPKIQPQVPGHEPILPAVLEFPEAHQEAFLQNVITDLDVNLPTCIYAPAYTLYLCARYFLLYKII